MSPSSSTQRLALFALFLLTLGTIYLCNDDGRTPVLAATSPLAQPWPTLVVDYPPQLEGVGAPPAVQPQVVHVSYGVHAPLPLPTLLPDAFPPTTVLTVSGELGNEGWLRSPATLPFALSHNLGAGVSEYRLDGASEWTEREYYYPSVLWSAEGIHTLEYHSLDMAHNAETVQSTLLRIDHTPPQLTPPLLDGNQLAN